MQPYDLKIKYDKTQAGAAMYEVVPSPKSEEVPEHIVEELAKKKPLAQVVQDEMNRGKNMDDEHVIKITGKGAIPAPLAMDQDVTLKVTGSVVAIQQGSNQDGTVDVTYKVKAVSIEVQ